MYIQFILTLALISFTTVLAIHTLKLQAQNELLNKYSDELRSQNREIVAQGNETRKLHCEFIKIFADAAKDINEDKPKKQPKQNVL